MDPETQLQGFIAKFTPEIAALANSALAVMRERYPQAVQLVYDNYNAPAIGFGPTERTSEAIFSLAVYPRRVNLCFLQAGPCELSDPAGLLQGSGTQNRFIPLVSVTTLDDSAVLALMAEAWATAALAPSAVGQLVIKSISARQRPRQPAASISEQTISPDVDRVI